MIKVETNLGRPSSVWISEGGSDVQVLPSELDQLIQDLQEAAVRLKANQLGSIKSPTEKLEEEIAQLKERVNMLEHANLRKL